MSPTAARLARLAIVLDRLVEQALECDLSPATEPEFSIVASHLRLVGDRLERALEKYDERANVFELPVRANRGEAA